MKLLKEKDNYYLINDEKKIKLEMEVVHKFKLYYEDESLLVEEIISENNYYFYYKLALKRLSKMQSQKMLENYLETKGIDQITLKKVIKRLTELKYLDDYEYAKNYINLKMYSFGPLKLENKLIEDGVNYRIVKELVSEIDEAEILQGFTRKRFTKNFFINL
jgi:regulatory protein